MDTSTAFSPIHNQLANPVKVPFVLFAEAANHGPERVLNILGSFDSMTADFFPVIRPQLSGVVWFVGDEGDDLPAKVWLRLINESGELGLWEATATIAKEEGKEDRLVKGQVIFQAFGVVFPEPGDYYLAVHVGTEELYRKKLELRLRDLAASE